VAVGVAVGAEVGALVAVGKGVQVGVDVGEGVGVGVLGTTDEHVVTRNAIAKSRSFWVIGFMGILSSMS
jgi:hypothetical protein